MAEARDGLSLNKCATLSQAERREYLLAQLAAVWGEARVDEALELAVEAGKAGLTADRIEPLTRHHAWLDLVGALPAEGATFRTWALEHGFISEETWRQVDEVDLLGMRDDPALGLHPERFEPG